MKALTLDAIRLGLESEIPALIATCAADGTPNCAYLSQVEYVDPSHVALSWQFFNKTRDNVLAKPRGVPRGGRSRTIARYRILIRYLRTETSGRSRAHEGQARGIASHTGMEGVFKLRGSDVYRVESIERVPGPVLPAAAGAQEPARRGARLRPQDRAPSRTCSRSSTRRSTASRTISLRGPQALILLRDAGEGACTPWRAAAIRLRRGVRDPAGQGVIGVAARERTPIRIGFAQAEYAYGARSGSRPCARGSPSRPRSRCRGGPSRTASSPCPSRPSGRLLGVLFVESDEDLRFGYDDEDALVAVAGQLGTSIHVMQAAAEAEEAPAEGDAIRTPVAGPPLAVRHFAENDSIFLGRDSLIKGVAAASSTRSCRTSSPTGARSSPTGAAPRPAREAAGPERQPRGAPDPPVRRLDERDAGIRIEKSGRGRFRLVVSRPIELVAAG